MTDATTDDGADMVQIRAERDELRMKVEKLEDRSRRRGWWRRAVVVVLVVLSCLSFVVAVPGVWARRNFLSTDRFVSRAAPLIHDPAVQAAVSNRITLELMQLIDPKELFQQVLPERGQVLAVPLANAVQGFVHDKVDSFVQTEQFATLWEGALRVAHSTSAKVIRGDTKVVTAENGQVTLNLIPIVDAVLARITSASPEILGRTVNLPDVKVEDIPQAAITRLESALGVQLPDNFGQFTVYDNGKLEAAQKGVKLFDQTVVLLLPLAVLLAALALWLSRRRRRTLLQLVVGVVIGMVLLRRVGFRLDDEVAALAPTAQGRAAVAVIANAFLAPLTTFALWSALVALIVGAVALVSGPYGWAGSLRHRSAELWTGAVSATSDRAKDEATVAWVGAHRDALLAIGAVAGVLLLWAANGSWFGLFVVIALVALYEAVVYRIASRALPVAPADGDAEADTAAEGPGDSPGSRPRVVPPRGAAPSTS